MAEAGGGDWTAAAAVGTAGRVLAEVLERQAFLFLDPPEPEEDSETYPGEALALAIAFSGHARGRATLLLPRALAVELAANVLGTEPDDPEAEARAVDACKELLNIFAGNLLTFLWGPEPSFELGLPESLPGDPGKPAAGEAEASFVVEERPMRLRLRIDYPEQSPEPVP